MSWLNPLGILQYIQHQEGKFCENHYPSDTFFLAFLKDAHVQKSVIIVFSLFSFHILANPILLTHVKTHWEEGLMYSYFFIY